MKNVFLSLSAFLFLSSPIMAQEVNKKQWTFMHERTADWCPLCGGWGWDFKTKLINEFQGKPVVFTALHHSGGLSNPTSVALGTNFGGAGQPRFYVDGTDLIVSSGNQTARLEDAKLIVDFNQASVPYAGIGIDAIVSPINGNVQINATVEILEKIDNGDYYLGLYTLEDLTAYQETKGTNALHKNVLTGSVFTETFGKSVFTGSGEKGKTFQFSTAITEDLRTKIDKVTILGVLWNKSAGKHLFFNALEVPLKLQSSTVNSDVELGMNVFANEAGDINIDLNLEDSYSDVVLQLTDVSGKVVSAQEIFNINAGKSNYHFSNIASGGTYFISFITYKSLTTKAVIIP